MWKKLPFIDYSNLTERRCKPTDRHHGESTEDSAVTGLPSLWTSVKIGIFYTIQHVQTDSTAPSTRNLVQRLLILDIANVRGAQGCVQDRTGITPCASCTSAKIRTLEQTVQADALVRAGKACTGPRRYLSTCTNLLTRKEIPKRVERAERVERVETNWRKTHQVIATPTTRTTHATCPSHATCNSVVRPEFRDLSFGTRVSGPPGGESWDPGLDTKTRYR